MFLSGEMKEAGDSVTFPCRCGDDFSIESDEVSGEGSILIECDSCSLILQIDAKPS